MTSIAPPGTDTSKWPKALGPQQLAVRESAAKVKIANDNIEKNKQLINGITERYKAFFVAHFGIPPIDGIYKMYYQGKIVKQGGGPGNALAIAQEIMEYTNPSAAEYGLTKETVIGLTTAMCRFYDLYNIKQQADAEAQGFLEAAIFQLEYRPSAEAVQAFGKDLPSALKNGSNKAKSDKPYYGFANGSTTKQHPTHNHIKMFARNILKYYGQAYSRTPSYFWEFTSKHRIYAEADHKFGGIVKIKVAQVDAATGALGRGISYTMAQYTPTPGMTQDLVLAQFKEYMFPEMFLLSAGVVVDAEQRESLYADQLKSASNLWTGIPDKANTPYAVVLDQSFTYSPGTPPVIVKQPGQNTSKPISMLTIYMQPTGIEEAMKKILDVNYAGNAIEQWFTKSYIPSVMKMGLGRDYPYMVSMEQDKWNTYMKSVPAIMSSLYAVLNHPGLYQYGISFVDTLISKSNRSEYMQYVMGDGSSSSKTALEHVKLIMSYANWPTAAPQKLFEAPFDDQRDILTLTGLFNRYMNENHAVAPPTMYLPEAFNGRINSRTLITGANAQSSEQAGTPNQGFSFSKGTAYPMSRSRTHPLYLSGTTYIRVLYSRNAKTVLSKTSLADLTMSNLPMQIDARVIRQSDSRSTPADMDQGASVAVAAVVTAGAVAATGPIGLVALPLVYGLTRMV